MADQTEQDIEQLCTQIANFNPHADADRRVGRRLQVTEAMVVKTAQYVPHEGLPIKVQESLVADHARRQQILDMWKEGGKTSFYIPGSVEGRKMKMQAKLLAKQMAKDELILKEAGKPHVISDAHKAEPIKPLAY